MESLRDECTSRRQLENQENDNGTIVEEERNRAFFRRMEKVYVSRIENSTGKDSQLGV